MNKILTRVHRFCEIPNDEELANKKVSMTNLLLNEITEKFKTKQIAINIIYEFNVLEAIATFKGKLR